jgi:hypothetical protein
MKTFWFFTVLLLAASLALGYWAGLGAVCFAAFILLVTAAL